MAEPIAQIEDVAYGYRTRLPEPAIVQCELGSSLFRAARIDVQDAGVGAATVCNQPRLRL